MNKQIILDFEFTRLPNCETPPEILAVKAGIVEDGIISRTMTYATKNVKDIKKKLETAKKLWK